MERKYKLGLAFGLGYITKSWLGCPERNWYLTPAAMSLFLTERLDQFLFGKPTRERETCLTGYDRQDY
jgi:hypothetical protein